MKKIKQVLTALLATILMLTAFISIINATENDFDDEITKEEMGFGFEIEPWEVVFASSFGRVLNPKTGAEIGKLKRGSSTRQANGFAVSLDEKYAFLGYVGGAADLRSVEMIDLDTGKAIANYQHIVSDVYYAPRGLAAGKGNTLFIGLDSVTGTEGTYLAVATYSESGITKVSAAQIKDDTGAILVRVMKYVEIQGTAYLYLVTGDHARVASTAKDRIYRYIVTDNTVLTIDETFGNKEGYIEINSLTDLYFASKKSRFSEIYSIDVAKDGTIYARGPEADDIAKIASDGKSVLAVWASTTVGNNSDQGGGIVLIDNEKHLLVIHGSRKIQIISTETGTPISTELFAQNINTPSTATSITNVLMHPVLVNGNLYINERGNGGNVSQINKEADKIWKANYVSGDIRFVGHQKTAVDAEGGFNARFAAVIDSTDYIKAGFDITVTKQGGATEEYRQDCRFAYTSLLSAEGPITAASCGGKYFVAVVFPNIPAADGEFTVKIKPYVVRAGSSELIYGKEYTFTVTPGLT